MHPSESPEDQESPSDQQHLPEALQPVSRWLQVLSGLLILGFGGLCLLSSVFLIIDPFSNNTLFTKIIGLALFLISSWVIFTAIRWIFGINQQKPTFNSFFLTGFSLMVFCFPVVGFYNGYFVKHPIKSIIQTVFCIGISISLARLAIIRSRPTA